ncbi:conserved hypothetical protein, partial [Ixodes scapularis]
DIQNLPYFDSQSLAGDFDDFKTPECGTPTEVFETPPTSRPGWLATGCGTDPERERARREARERARLKSDEELGLNEATPVASPARSVEELDRPDVVNASAACAIVPMDPYQIRADVEKGKLQPRESGEGHGRQRPEPDVLETEAHQVEVRQGRAEEGRLRHQRRLERLTLRVQRQQELKRLRTAQEIQRRLEEIEVSLRALERRGVLIERALRGEEDEDEDLRTDEKDLTQVLFRLMRQKNKLSREEQELLIRVRDLELENHHSKLQQEMRERMAVDDKEKSPRDIEKERQILSEMLEIVEKRDRLVAQMDQLRIRWVHT